MIVGAVLATILIIAVTIGLGVLADRKLGLAPRPETLAEPPPRKRAPTYAAGEAPATAIRAGSVQLDRLRTSQRCTSCREPLTAADQTRVRYDNRDLLVIQFRCARCNAKRALYVEPAPSL